MNADTAVVLAASKSVAILRKTSGRDALKSAREAPVNVPQLVNLASALSSGVNGARDLGIQRAAVEYLSAEKKMTIPEALFAPRLPSAAADTDEVAAHIFFNTTIGLSGDVPPHGAFVTGRIADSNDVDIIGASGAGPWAGHPRTWTRFFGATAETKVHYVHVEFKVGDYDETGAFVDDALEDSDSFAWVIVKYGPADGDVFAFVMNTPPKEVKPTSFLEMLQLDNALSLLSDAVSIELMINYGVNDHGFLANADNRWPDTKCNDELDKDMFKPKLGAHTQAMIAALNVASVGDDPILAWVRSYGVSLGLLPAAPPDSLHDVEYNTTVYMPENAEVASIAAAHPAGDEGRKFMRGCLSILAGFGMLHLANDHTYKPSDEHLKRKARVLVECVRTIFPEDIINRLKADNMLEHTVRTACHPFGLSSPWALFKAGQSFNFIAEPLCDRKTTLPPPVAKVGLVCAVMDKIVALPIGGKVRKAYAEQFTIFRTLKEATVRNATAYSSLHKHYGIENQMTLTAEQEAAVKNLKPFCAAYALVFEKNSDGDPKGAALSPMVTAIANDADVIMYQQAFEKYARESEDLNKLIGDVAAASASASGSLV